MSWHVSAGVAAHDGCVLGLRDEVHVRKCRQVCRAAASVGWLVAVCACASACSKAVCASEGRGRHARVRARAETHPGDCRSSTSFFLGVLSDSLVFLLLMKETCEGVRRPRGANLGRRAHGAPLPACACVVVTSRSAPAGCTPRRTPDR